MPRIYMYIVPTSALAAGSRRFPEPMPKPSYGSSSCSVHRDRELAASRDEMSFCAVLEDTWVKAWWSEESSRYDSGRGKARMVAPDKAV